MIAKISVFVFCVGAIINLSLYNSHDCTFNVEITSNKKCFSDFKFQI